MNAQPAPDLEQARRFLEALGEEADWFTFQLATDNPAVKKSYPKDDRGRPQDPLAKVLHLPTDRLDILAARNAEGAAVWACINETDGRGREARNVTRCRAVFIDGDGQVTLDQLLALDLEPHLITETSPGHYQAFWFVDGLDLDQAEGVQRKLAKVFGTDTICDRCRVMRVPGLLHQKDPGNPHLVRTVHVSQRLPYKPADILRAWPPLTDAGPRLNGHASLGTDDLPPPLDQARVDQIRAKHPDAFDLARYDGDASRRDLALASIARKLGMSKQEAAGLIRAVRNDGKESRADYVWRTVEKAWSGERPDEPHTGGQVAGQLVFDPREPLPIARSFTQTNYAHKGDQILHRHRGEFYVWTGARYAEMGEPRHETRL